MKQLLAHALQRELALHDSRVPVGAAADVHAEQVCVCDNDVGSIATNRLLVASCTGRGAEDVGAARGTCQRSNDTQTEAV